MTSPARVSANGRNAQRSTGPRTPAGLARASQNAYKHGLYATAKVVAACEEAGFRDWLGQWHDDYRPDGTAETNAIDRAAHELGHSHHEYVLKNYLVLYLDDCKRQGLQPSHMLFPE